jgi:acetyl esterase
VYTPAGSGPFPALVFFHGGGWVMGSVPGSDATCRSLANAAGCVIVSVEYRLAPEHKFPAAAEDCYAATRWAAENAGAIDVDPARIAVGGVSAGGNLAAVVPLMARDRGGPTLVHQLLVVPVIDRDFSTASYRQNAEGYGLGRDAMIWYWNHYLRGDEDARNPYAAPLQATDLSGLPPATVLTAEYDPLRDEGAAYAHRLRGAGVPVQHTCYDGMIHAFFSMASVITKGRQAVDDAAAALRIAFAQQPAVSAGDS